MHAFIEHPGALEWRGPQREVLRVEAWGTDSVRVRAGYDAIQENPFSALLPPPPGDAATTAVEDSARLVNGRLVVEIDSGGRLRFLHDERELLAEQPGHMEWLSARFFSPREDGRYQIEQRFRAYDGERLYGLGQRLHGRLDQKGCVVDLAHNNGEMSIPFLVSNRGYGLLWNLPGLGRAELGHTLTRWVAEAGRQIDYWFTAADAPAEVMSRYADATGHAPMLPEWAAGFWQSKLRYRTQEELLAVAREHQRRGLPLSVIVCDFFHWSRMGDWRFDPEEWPDPAVMVAELESMGTKLLVSVWPTVNPLSENYAEMHRRGLLVRDVNGEPLVAGYPDKGGFAKTAFYDPTHPEARRFVWERVRENYYRHGIRLWWLDACEPDFQGPAAGRARYAAGDGLEIANLYPKVHTQAFHEGMIAEGENDIVMLVRSGWAGSQRFAAAVWSGDIPATFESLAIQVRAGLNVAMSGIPWWTTDIGGFHGGDSGDPDYRELMVRWFQYGTFCPLFRLHGDREPRTPFTVDITGGPNEIWSYGDEAYEILRAHLLLRERLRPYVMRQMRAAHEAGTPPMRPLFVDFPDDDSAWAVEDQFMFGPDVLVAPVTAHDVRERDVYLPAATGWVDAWTGERVEGGATVSAPAPLAHIPVYLREGSPLDADWPRDLT